MSCVNIIRCNHYLQMNTIITPLLRLGKQVSTVCAIVSDLHLDNTCHWSGGKLYWIISEMNVNQVQKYLLHLTQIFIDSERFRPERDDISACLTSCMSQAIQFHPVTPLLSQIIHAWLKYFFQEGIKSWSKYIGGKETHFSFCNFYPLISYCTLTFFPNFSFEFVWLLFPVISSINIILPSAKCLLGPRLLPAKTLSLITSPPFLLLNKLNRSGSFLAAFSPSLK